MIDVAEVVVRAAGLAALLGAWMYSGIGAVVGGGRESGRSVGLATRLRAHGAYLLGAVPYFGMCVLLWRPIPVDPHVGWRLALLVVGGVIGFAGAWLYFAGRRELGRMYNVSSSLGTALYGDHVLITTGPYSVIRHPMYVGLFLSAFGGLLVYRTWTFVFIVCALVGAVVKAGMEEKLLAEEFGNEWDRYVADVPGWVPRWRPMWKEEGRVNATAQH